MSETETHPQVTLIRRDDIIEARVAGRELGILIDGQDHWIVDPYLNAGRELFGVTEILHLDPAWLPSVAEARAIDAMPAPDLVPESRD